MVYYFSVSTIVDPSKEGPEQKSPMLSFLIRLCWDSHFFRNTIPYVKLNEVSFGDRNVCAHLLIGIGCEKNITYTQ